MALLCIAVNGFAAIFCANFDWGSDPQIFSSRGGSGSVSNTVLFWTTQVSLSNGTSVCLTTLAGCMTVKDRRTDSYSSAVPTGGIITFSDAAK